MYVVEAADGDAVSQPHDLAGQALSAVGDLDHFACEIGWLVEDGAITGIVRNPTYSSPTLPFWRCMSAVGNASTCELVQVANCGKGLPSQVMRLGHCVPVCRFDNVQIGL